MPSERVGPYRLETRLGAGGMGEVYKAYDVRLDRWVALKRISPDRCTDAEQRERLRREARASARLSHPAIVQVFDLLQVDGADCIVMELVEGAPLSLLLRKGPLELPRDLASPSAVLEVLEAASFELTDASAWYDERVAGLGDRLLSEVRNALDFVARNPAAGSPWLLEGIVGPSLSLPFN